VGGRVSAPAELDALWRRAVDRWSTAIALATPIAIPEVDGPIAYIDLATRQTHVNFGRLAAMNVSEHVECVLAHEVGHHIRYPHTLLESRRMLRFLREIAADLLWDARGGVDPSRFDWLLNVFFDLLINDELSTEYEPSFVAIFRGMQGDWGLAFSFYVGVFEELWALPKHAIVTERQDRALAKVDKEWRARAASTGEFVRAHPENRPLQLARFLTAIRPFVLRDRDEGRDQGEAFERGPWGSGALDGDAVADLLRGRNDEEQARRWLRENAQLNTKSSATASAGSPLERARLQLQDLAPPEAIALAAYRKEADRAHLEIPASLEPGEPFVPGPHESWNLGDDLDAVDWIGSVARSGSRPIPSINTYARTFLPDDPRPGDRETPWIELYVDSSGSMPDAKVTYSHQIEAGFILVRAATRAGGRVRVIQYASMDQRKMMEGFVRTAAPAENALLEYIGGGTDFPWDELIASTKKYRRLARVRRVVISDSDFVANFRNPTPAVDSKRALADAAAAGGFTGLLAIAPHYGEELRATGMEVVPVSDWSTIGDAARALADALFRVKTRSREAAVR